MKTHNLIYDWFIKKSGDKDIYYPFGGFGKGYKVGPEKQAQVRRFFSKFSLVSFIIIMILVITIKLYALLTIPVLMVLYVFFVKHLFTGLEETHEPNVSRSDILNNITKTFGIFGSILMILFSLLVLGVSLVGIIFIKKIFLINIINGILSIGGIVIFSLTARRSINKK
jgi:hypothetical protein